MAYSFEKETNLIKDGDYEVKIEKIEKKVLPSGKEKLALTYRIRDDIEGQRYGNKCVFEDIWQEKDNPQFFNRKRLNQLLGTQEIAEGTIFETIDDIINVLVGSYLITHIVTVFSDYWGEDINTISYYKSSKHKPQSLEVKKEEIVVASEELPF